MTEPRWTVIFDGTEFVPLPLVQASVWLKAMKREHAEQLAIKLNADSVTDQATVLDFGGHPENLDKLMIARTRIWNECMGLLGVNNANQDKKERLVADEVEANDEQVMAMKNVALNARRMAAGRSTVRSQ